MYTINWELTSKTYVNASVDYLLFYLFSTVLFSGNLFYRPLFELIL